MFVEHLPVLCLFPLNKITKIKYHPVIAIGFVKSEGTTTFFNACFFQIMNCFAKFHTFMPSSIVFYTHCLIYFFSWLFPFRELYPAIEAVIKNLMTSLRAVTDLQNPAIKDRHWLELMMATKVSKDFILTLLEACVQSVFALRLSLQHRSSWKTALVIRLLHDLLNFSDIW